MEDKDFYTQTEVANLLGKSLSNLAFYKDELRQKEYMIQVGNKEVITKEGINYLKLRFSETYKKQQPRKETPKEDEPKEFVKEDKEEKAKNNEEIESLKQQIRLANEEKEYYKKQMERWQTQCDSWQKQADEQEVDKQFWRDFAMQQNELVNQRLLPEKVEEPKFSLFGRRKRRQK